MVSKCAVVFLTLVAAVSAVSLDDVRTGFEQAPAAGGRKLLAAAEVAATEAQLAQVKSLFDKWNAALQTGNPKTVAALYAPNGVLIPTVDNGPLTGKDIERYFVSFLTLGPKGTINQRKTRFINAKTAIDSGIYTFKLKDGSSVSARFTYVYQQQPNGEWRIQTHHSSKLPVPEKETNIKAAPKKEMSQAQLEKEIRAAFANWAKTAEKGKPELMVPLYTTDATLLPTVDNISPNSRTIEKYFESFLAKGPKGTVVKDIVTKLGRDAAVYQGQYVFKFKDGSSVPARFSLVFVKRGNKWLIADMHSSKLPDMPAKKN